MGTDNYSAASNNMKFVHWSLMGGLLYLVQRRGDSALPQPAKAPLRCTKCNSPPINGQCTNHRIAVWSVAQRFNVTVNGLIDIFFTDYRIVFIGFFIPILFLRFIIKPRRLTRALRDWAVLQYANYGN